ncbi:MAG: chromosomal replication initiator protein DnaA [Desulfobacterota bacterium]|nr:chromosomal replication initiator protein DnaA [Thermodesulfobacteriota bacterium]
MWIEPLEAARDSGDDILLNCPNLFSLNWVREKYLPLFQEISAHLQLGRTAFAFQVSAVSRATVAPPGIHQIALPGLDRPDWQRYQQGFTFDHFVTGPSNRFAYLATLALATDQNIYNNTLFLHSPNGLGKTHLSQAVGHHLSKHKPQAKVLYLSAEAFTQEMVLSLKSNRMETFKDKYRRHCDYLILEEVHFLSGKETTQAELGYTLESLLNENKKIILTSSYLPKDIPRLGGKLKSQLSSALLGSIDPPDFETRLGIIRNKSKGLGLDLTIPVREFLADQPFKDIRQLESCLSGIKAQVILLNQTPDLALAETVVKKYLFTQQEITIQDIQVLVGRHFKITPEEMVSKSRKRSHLYPRNLSIYLSKQFTNQTLEAIGRAFNRDYSSIIHAVNAVEKSLKKDAQVYRQIHFFSDQLAGSRRPLSSGS